MQASKVKNIELLAFYYIKKWATFSATLYIAYTGRFDFEL